MPGGHPLYTTLNANGTQDNTDFSMSSGISYEAHVVAVLLTGCFQVPLTQ